MIIRNSIARSIVVFLLALLITTGPAYAQKRIAFSFDDAPRDAGAFFTPDERTKKLIKALKTARVKQAVFFVTPGNLEKPTGVGGEARIARYTKAGHVIANHSYDHTALTAMTAEAYLADIDKAEAWLKGRKGYRPWFRFPYLNEGQRDKVKRDAIRAGLNARGLQNGYVTAEASDWNMETLTVAAKAANRPYNIGDLRNYYVTLHVEAANVYNDLAVKTIGRSPAHMLLLHETDIAALFIGDLVAALRKDGWEIITADAAYADPISKVMPDVPSAQGSLIEAMAWEKKLPAPRWYKYNDTDLATKLFNENVLKEASDK